MENEKKKNQKSGKNNRTSGGDNLGAELIMLGLEMFRLFPKGPEFGSDLKKATEKEGVETILLSGLEYLPVDSFYDDLLESQRGKQ